MTERTNDEINLAVAEALGYRCKDDGTGEWWDREGWGIHEAELPDFCTDPAAILMLMERLHEFGSVTLCGANGWGVYVENISEGGNDSLIRKVYVRPDLTNSPNIGLAVAKAFLAAKGDK